MLSPALASPSASSHTSAISAVLVAHNSGSDLLEAVESILHETQQCGLEVELIVVDNKSSDDSCIRLQEWLNKEQHAELTLVEKFRCHG